VTNQTALLTDEVIHETDVLSLAQLRDRALACRACKLCEERTNVVFGEGNPNRPLVAFVGEGPGDIEDQQGRPFVGPSGKMLDKMILKMGLDRAKDCYILNTVCCRPPGNRTPTPDEVIACRPLCHSQLRLIRPQTIITLGGTAATYLLGKQKLMHEFRGKWFKWEHVPVRPTFHPAYLLRNPKERGAALTDIEAVMRLIRANAAAATKTP
jgi:uracil-DNA glycosylase family 4